MKTRNIITIISIMATMIFASCSSEGDILSEMGNQQIPAENEVLAAVSCNIEGIKTKVGIDAACDDEISSGIFLLTKGTFILATTRMKM